MDGMVLQALHWRGEPVHGLAAAFDARGGSIGRAANNLMVLPDPDRRVSRVHARIRFANGHFMVEDLGAEPLLLNGRPVGLGQRVALSVGDRLTLGGYELVVSEAGSMPAADPPAARALPADASLLPPPSPPALPPRMLPDDWNPFDGLDGDDTATPPRTEPTLDDLFGLGASAQPDDDIIGPDAWMPAPSPPPSVDPVWFAVTAPTQLPLTRRFVAALAVHVESQRASAERQLQRVGGPLGELLTDLAPARQSGWRVGAPVTVRLDVRGGRAEPAEHAFEWNGRLHLAAFQVQAEETTTGALELCFHVLLAGMPMGMVPLSVQDPAATPAAAAPALQRAPSSAFASYASADAPAVGLCLSALSRWAPSLAIFQDCLDLQPGEAYKPQLERRIRDSDAFLLFWSRQAARSAWVRWEFDVALDGKGLDAVIPMPLEDPSLAPPPPELADRHWRDRYMMARAGLARLADVSTGNSTPKA